MRWLDLIFFSRPILLIPLWTIYLHYLAISDNTALPSFGITPGRLIQVIGLTLIFMAGYVLNQIFDVDTDRANDKLYFLPRGIISLDAAWWWYAVISALGLGLSFISSYADGLLVALILALGVLYSCPPIRLKDRPLWGLLANAGVYGLLVPLSVHHGGTTRDVSGIPPYFFAVASAYLLTTIPDRPGDAAAGKRTFAVQLGVRGILWLTLILLTFAGIWSSRVDNFEMAAAAGIALLLVAAMLVHPHDRLLMLACKMPILLLTLCAAAHYPVYAIVLLLTIALTRLYYRVRFGVVYPTMS